MAPPCEAGAAACGLPATLWLYPDRVKIVTAGGRHEAVHPRFPTVGTVSYLPGQRAAQLAHVFGNASGSTSCASGYSSSGP